MLKFQCVDILGTVGGAMSPVGGAMRPVGGATLLYDFQMDNSPQLLLVLCVTKEKLKKQNTWCPLQGTQVLEIFSKKNYLYMGKNL